MNGKKEDVLKKIDKLRYQLNLALHELYERGAIADPSIINKIASADVNSLKELKKVIEATKEKLTIKKKALNRLLELQSEGKIKDDTLIAKADCLDENVFKAINNAIFNRVDGNIEKAVDDLEKADAETSAEAGGKLRRPRPLADAPAMKKPKAKVAKPVAALGEKMIASAEAKEKKNKSLSKVQEIINRIKKTVVKKNDEMTKSVYEWKDEDHKKHKDGGYPFKVIGSKVPKGWKQVDSHFVDSSGFGAENEAALTQKGFHSKLKTGRGYAITDAGQFQVHVGEFEKEKKPTSGKIKKIIDRIVQKGRVRGVPDGTGPYGQGKGPGKGKADGSGLKSKKKKMSKVPVKDILEYDDGDKGKKD